MKLREYLEQFKSLDPELEVYNFDNSISFTKLWKKGKISYTFRFIESLKDENPPYMCSEADYFDKKVLVLY